MLKIISETPFTNSTFLILAINQANRLPHLQPACAPPFCPLIFCLSPTLNPVATSPFHATDEVNCNLCLLIELN